MEGKGSERKKTKEEIYRRREAEREREREVESKETWKNVRGKVGVGGNREGEEIE